MSIPNVPQGSPAHVSFPFGFKHRNGPGLVFLNWPMWDSKENIPFLVVDWMVQTPFTVTWVNYRASCPIIFRSGHSRKHYSLNGDASDVIFQENMSVRQEVLEVDSIW